MKEFLLEVIFALVVFCSLYEVSRAPDAMMENINAGTSVEGPAPITVETATFVVGSELGVQISAAVFQGTIQVAELAAPAPLPLPRPDRT